MTNAVREADYKCCLAKDQLKIAIAHDDTDAIIRYCQLVVLTEQEYRRAWCIKEAHDD